MAEVRLPLRSACRGFFRRSIRLNPATDGSVKVIAILDAKVEHYPKELYILTGMETRQLFRRMFVMLKNSKELFYPT